MQRVLFVCAQNVCRSPYLELELGRLLGEAHTTPVTVVSRGTHARGGRDMCALAVSKLSARGSFAVKVAAHTSRQLKAADVERADLILTAGTAERSAVAVLDPAARTRVFTVREALRLSDDPIPALGVDGGADTNPLQAYAGVLHSRRGTLAIPTKPAPTGFFRRRRAGSSGESALDIPDAHTQSSAAHERLFAELERDASRLGQRIASVLKTA